jgi:hypothetical protein
MRMVYMFDIGVIGFREAHIQRLYPVSTAGWPRPGPAERRIRPNGCECQPDGFSIPNKLCHILCVGGGRGTGVLGEIQESSGCES